jgi:hypothetical protein
VSALDFVFSRFFRPNQASPMAEREAGLMSALDDSIKFNSPTEALPIMYEWNR